ncbi:MAG: hypothetical protein PHX73_09375 [Acidobacteriota bacterium]|nr:hypothetical protein [Acidobacteriota bacterium]
MSKGTLKRIGMLAAAVVLFAAVHEGMHAVLALLWSEYGSFAVRPYGFEVIYQTPVAERAGLKWGFISGAGNATTIFLGYFLYGFRAKLAALRSPFSRGLSFYAAIIFLSADPFNLSIGPFFYGGDIGGLVAGFGLNRFLIQGFFLLILLFNRELIARRILPLFGVRTKHPLFRPWFKPD